jgi:hypothetical protein
MYAMYVIKEGCDQMETFFKPIIRNMSMNVMNVMKKNSLEQNIHTQPLHKPSLWERFSKWVERKRWQGRLNKLIREGYISNEYEPLKCIKCESNRLRWSNIDSVDTIVTEKEVRCNDCDTVAAYWVTGSWDFEVHVQ